MAQNTLLHSGEFTDHNGDTIRVSFFQRIDVNYYPTTIIAEASAGTVLFSFWSRDGELALLDPQVDWANWNYTGDIVSVEPVLGTRYHKYTIRIILDENPGTQRSTQIPFKMEDGPFAGQVDMSATLIQRGQN